MIGQTPERTEAAGTQLPIHVDGHKEFMSAYNIGGNNYVRLRDVAAVVDFGIEWDATRRRVLIDTTKPYTLELPETPIPELIPVTNPNGSEVDYSLQANPAIFDDYYTREKYNIDRQRILDTGTNVNWGTKRAPQSIEAIATANSFFDSLMMLSEFEKVSNINSFLCARMTYSSNVEFSGEDFWTGMAYGVCEDYARIFQYMCYRAGIPCLYVIGVTDGNGHAWNEVYVDSKWQFYDGNLSDIRQALALGEAAKSGHKYTYGSPDTIMYQKELFIPSSTF